jgi:hypothetical protein
LVFGRVLDAFCTVCHVNQLFLAVYQDESPSKRRVGAVKWAVGGAKRSVIDKYASVDGNYMPVDGNYTPVDGINAAVDDEDRLVSGVRQSVEIGRRRARGAWQSVRATTGSLCDVFSEVGVLRGKR